MAAVAGLRGTFGGSLVQRALYLICVSACLRISLTQHSLTWETKSFPLQMLKGGVFGLTALNWGGLQGVREEIMATKAELDEVGPMGHRYYG